MVDDDGAAVDLHAELFKPEILSVALHTDRRDQRIGRNGQLVAGLGLDMGGDAVLRLVDLGHFGVGDDLDAALLEALLHVCGDLGILDRQDGRQQFDHRHLGAERTVERCELHADGARAHDDQGFREFCRLHRLEIGPDLLAVGLDAGQHARPCAGSDDDVLGLVRAFAQRVLGNGSLRLHHRLARLADLDLARRRQLGLAPDDIDLVLLHQELDAVVHLSGDLARTVDDGGNVEAEVTGRQAVVLGVAHMAVDLGGAEQRLGRDAAPVGADAGHVLTLDDGGLQPQLRRADSGNIAARTGAYDDEIV